MLPKRITTRCEWKSCGLNARPQQINDLVEWLIFLSLQSTHHLKEKLNGSGFWKLFLRKLITLLVRSYEAGCIQISYCVEQLIFYNIIMQIICICVFWKCFPSFNRNRKMTWKLRVILINVGSNIMTSLICPGQSS